MELITLITMLCICLSSLQSPCAASLQIQVQPSHDQPVEVQLSLPTLPRKLRVLTAEATDKKEHAAKDKIMSHDKPKEEEEEEEDVPPAGDTNRAYKKEQQGGGRWQEWVDRSQYFTMDYSPVRRRRPIHNKSLPAAP